MCVGKQSRGEKLHLVRMAELLTEKNAELSKGDPNLVFKGRCVLLGNMVKDERWEAAVSSEAASDPATLEAAGALDAYSCIGDHTASQSDVTSACTQRFLRGTPAWTSIPRERWPADWRGKFFNPVVPQVLNTYGHPEAGAIWEEHFEDITFDSGFLQIDNHRACYWHPKLRVTMVV